MATCMTYSANYLTSIRKLAHHTSNFSLFALNTSLRSKVIALSIRENCQNNPYRRLRGGQNFSHQICTLLNSSRHQQHIGNLNSPPTINRANLRIIHLVNTIPGKTKNLQYTTINCRSIVNKSADLKVEISNNSIDFCALTETWIREDDTITPLEICPLGYKSISIPRQNRQGGGVAIVYRNTLSLTHNFTYNF